MDVKKRFETINNMMNRAIGQPPEDAVQILLLVVAELATVLQAVYLQLASDEAKRDG